MTTTKESSTVPEKYTPRLQERLTEMISTYKVELHPDAKPTAVTYPQGVPIPFLPKVRQEIDRIEKLGVIEREEHATRGWALIAVARQPDNTLRICVDYMELNYPIIRERVIMLNVEENLTKIQGPQF